LDDVIGTLSVARLLALRHREHERIEPYVAAAVFVPETLNGMALLEQFRAQASRMLFVVDEYGVVQGLLTPHDLLEAITGELQPQTQGDAWATEQAAGRWLLDGRMPVAELKARLGLRDLPWEDRGRYNTLAGLLMALTGQLPPVGAQISCAGWCFEVAALDGRRIDRVQAQRE